MAAGRAVGVLPRTLLAALCFAAIGRAASAATPRAPEPRRLALRVPDTFPLPPLEGFTTAARQRGVEVQNAPEGLPVPKGWEVAHLWILPVDDRWKPLLDRFPVTFEGNGFVFEGRAYSGKDDAIFLADPSRPGEAFIVAGSDREALELAQSRLVLREGKPADYEVVSGELTKEGRFAVRDGRLAVDPSSDRDGIAARDAFFRDLKREKRGSIDWEFSAADSAAVDRWEKAAAKFAGKRAFTVRVFPDTVSKALYTGSSRPADLATDGKTIRVDIDASAPEEPDLIAPALAAASIAAANPSLLGRPTLLMAAGARRYGKWWGRETKSFSALVHAAGVEPSVEEILKTPEDVSPVFAVGAAAAWLDAGARLETDALVEKALAEPEASLAKKLSAWRDAAWRQAVKPPERRPLPEGFLRGVSYAMSNAIAGAYIAPASLATLKRLKDLSANSISVMPYGLARDPAADKILFVHHSARGETDEAIVRAVTDARSLGMTALVKPQLWVGTGAAVGEIAMPDERALAGVVRLVPPLRRARGDRGGGVRGRALLRRVGAAGDRDAGKGLARRRVRRAPGHRRAPRLRVQRRGGRPADHLLGRSRRDRRRFLRPAREVRETLGWRPRRRDPQGRSAPRRPLAARGQARDLHGGRVSCGPGRLDHAARGKRGAAGRRRGRRPCDRRPREGPRQGALVERGLLVESLLGREAGGRRRARVQPSRNAGRKGDRGCLPAHDSAVTPP